MKIIIFTNHFYPEDFRCNELASFLSSKGNEVTVLTAIPDYPEGKYYSGYSLFRNRTQTIDGIKIIRVPIIPRGKGGKFRLSLNYLSSAFCFFFYGLWQSLFHKYDAVIVHDTSPAFICLSASRLARIQKIDLHLWILDMWPESLVCGGIEKGFVYQRIDKMMKRVYVTCTKIYVSSKGFIHRLEERGVPSDKIVYFPNWCDNIETDSQPFRMPPLPDGFTIMYAGNIGEAQDIETVAKAAQLTSSDRIHWVFLGEGRKKKWLEDYVSQNALSSTIHILGRYPSYTMKEFFAKADIMLVSLRPSLIGDMTLPSRVQSFMSAGKPIIAMAGGETRDVIANAGCGWTVNPGDAKALAAAVKEAGSTGKIRLTELGKAGKEYSQSVFDKSRILETMLASL